MMRETMAGIKDVRAIGRAALRQMRVENITEVTAIRQAVASADGRLEPGAPKDIGYRGHQVRSRNPHSGSSANFDD
ncbi:hypothetical protein [Burkholderia anthina]|uniref:hypothetical protein n=1 Tax=Burkholderia anthina TaxID=179879 RepID=UPI0015897FE4